MPLRMLNIKPGFNKQFTASGAEGQWIDGDNVRFRYGLPEKIGGWQSLVNQTLIGPARAQHTWSDLDGRRYAAIGTNKILAIYYEGEFYDITPIDTDKSQTACNITTTNGSATVTITTPAPHGLIIGDFITFENAGSFTLPDTDYVAADFDEVVFEIKTVPSSTTFTITMPTVEGGTGATNDGTLDLLPYVFIGPAFETFAYGWGTLTWGFSTWGTERSASDVTLEAGSWSLDNYGQLLVATIQNGKTFTWDPIAVSGTALDTRATILTGAPTKSYMTLVSDRDRHLFHMGTETTIGDTSSYNRMFIRFSNQEDPEVYLPTATNTAGTFQLDAGSKIMGAINGKDYILVLTDTAAFALQFVGPPFVFSLRQVGTNCGLIGKNAVTYSNGVTYWMSNEGGFFAYDGTVKSLPCLVEDFVFNNNNNNVGLNYDGAEVIYGSHNTLYSEINWFYPSKNSFQIDRVVTYNYDEQTWTTGTLARTTYNDSAVYSNPHATQYLRTVAGIFPTVQGLTTDITSDFFQGASVYYEHEVGINELAYTGATNAIASFIRSGDYSLHEGGDAEFLLKVRRFIPDFKVLAGDAKVTLFFSDYPANTAASANTLPSITGPFTITTSTDKVDTRVRGRLVSLKIENDAVNQSWRYGTLRLDVQQDGRR
jgi:hypothetical protein